MTKLFHRHLSAGLLLLFVVQGCSLFDISHGEEILIHYPNPDPEMEQLVMELRDDIELALGERIAVVEDTLLFSKPEGALGNMVADALRYRAALELGTFVHLGIADDAAFKINFLPGTLTKGDVYEFMPYQQHLVVLELRGDQVTELLHQVAALDGAPISGARFTIDRSKRARGILVNSTIVEPDALYLVATTSLEAGTEEPFPALGSALRRTDLEISIRNVYLDFFRSRGRLTETTDGRIRS